MSYLRGNFQFVKNPKVQHNTHYIFSTRAFYPHPPKSTVSNIFLSLWKAINNLMVISGILIPPAFILSTLLIRYIHTTWKLLLLSLFAWKIFITVASTFSSSKKWSQWNKLGDAQKEHPCFQLYTRKDLKLGLMKHLGKVNIVKQLTFGSCSKLWQTQPSITTGSWSTSCWECSFNHFDQPY